MSQTDHPAQGNMQMKLALLCELMMEFWKEEKIWGPLSIGEEEQRTDLYKDLRQEEDMGPFLIKQE